MEKERNFRKELANFNFVDKYAHDKGERKETWDESIDRIYDMHRVHLIEKGINPDKVLIKEMIDAEKNKLFLSSQRARQWATSDVNRGILQKNEKMYNCCGSYADRIDYFGEFVYLLLCGCGVGSNICFRHVNKLHPVVPVSETTDKYYVQDSIEGWADLVKYVMRAYLETGSIGEIDYSLIREKGSLIAERFLHSGYEPLEAAVKNIRKVLAKRVGKKLRPIDVFDIGCFAAQCVLSGGVRRSATIFMFSYDDEEMMNAKVGNWYEENPQRAMANISPILVRDRVKLKDIENVVKSAREYGEPGILFANDEDFVTNPCGEIGLHPKDKNGNSGWQFCNLVEINMSKIKDKKDFVNACKYATRAATIQASYNKFDYLGEVSENITKEESLIGVSLTGVLDSEFELQDNGTLEYGALMCSIENEKIAEELGINHSPRCTTMKPSGNASILLETEAACNPAHSKYYLRHIRIARDKGMYSFIKNNCPELIMTDNEIIGSHATNSAVIAFPITSNGYRFKNDYKFIDNLYRVVDLYEKWVLGSEYQNGYTHHNISNTLIVKDNEWDDVAGLLFTNRYSVGGVSLLSEVGDRVYPYAPMCSIDFECENLLKKETEEYLDLYSECKKFGWDFINQCKLFDNDKKLRFINAFYIDKWAEISYDYDFNVDWQSFSNKKEYENIGNMAATACAGGNCTIL